MKFGTTITVIAASLGILASGLSAHAGDGTQPATPMPGHGASPSVGGTWGQEPNAAAAAAANGRQEPAASSTAVRTSEAPPRRAASG